MQVLIIKRTNKIPTIVILTLITIILTTIILALTINGYYSNNHNKLKDQIQIFLYNRATVMISDQNIIEKEITLTTEQFEKEKQLRNKIAQHRETLKKSNETYTQISTDIEIFELGKIGDNKVSIKVKETTYLINRKDNIKTGYAAEHKFILQKNKGNHWEIIEARYLDPIGLLPLYEMD